MDVPESEREKTTTRPVVEEPLPPFGLLAAILFVRLIAALTFFITAGAVLTALVQVMVGPFAEDPFPDALVASLLSVAVSVVLAVMQGGAVWLDSVLSKRPFSWAGEQGGHPARLLFLPIIGCVAGYGSVAVLAWLPSIGKSNVAETWLWPLAWGSIGAGALFLYRYLDRSLPR
ncbi:hypothetical protein [Luteolibacter soli]|uniref:Uncharacterized protein n=1 Tax=Luteolibacter soli TaxID=3135280 RepID=A0ABU9AT34_9BACT